jgi:hypothetical protein
MAVPRTPHPSGSPRAPGGRPRSPSGPPGYAGSLRGFRRIGGAANLDGQGRLGRPGGTARGRRLRLHHRVDPGARRRAALPPRSPRGRRRRRRRARRNRRGRTLRNASAAGGASPRRLRPAGDRRPPAPPTGHDRRSVRPGGLLPRRRTAAAPFPGGRRRILPLRPPLGSRRPLASGRPRERRGRDGSRIDPAGNTAPGSSDPSSGRREKSGAPSSWTAGAPTSNPPNRPISKPSTAPVFRCRPGSARKISRPAAAPRLEPPMESFSEPGGTSGFCSTTKDASS